MLRRKSFLFGVLGVLLFGGLAQASESIPAVRYVSGEIAWVDVQLGQLQLREEGLRGNRATTAYRINQQATNVTDSSDQQFLVLEDLRSGQLVAIEFEWIDNQGQKMARKITVQSPPEPVSQEAVGTLEAIDVNAGTLVLMERGNRSYFAFEPREIVVMRSPSRQPVRLELRPGDPVKVEFTVRDGKRRAHAITLYSALPELTDKTTTTTTTTSTTTTQ